MRKINVTVPSSSASFQIFSAISESEREREKERKKEEKKKEKRKKKEKEEKSFNQIKFQLYT